MSLPSSFCHSRIRLIGPFRSERRVSGGAVNPSVKPALKIREIVFLRGRSLQKCRFLCDERLEAWPVEDRFDIAPGAGIFPGIHLDAEVPEVRERTGYGYVRKGDFVADEEAAIRRDERFQIVENRRKLIAERSLSDRLVAGTIEETRRDDSVKEDFLSAPEQDRVGELVEPDDLYRAPWPRQGSAPDRDVWLRCSGKWRWSSARQ